MREARKGVLDEDLYLVAGQVEHLELLEASELVRRNGGDVILSQVEVTQAWHIQERLKVRV